MEKSFDFGRLLKNHEKKHKSKPTQFVSVAGGVLKRLENNLKYRKSSRLTTFDSIRNLSRCSSPAPLSEAQQKMEHRKQQLEKWKEEKEKKKKLAASQKKKPFVTGVPHAPLKFVPPPPLPPVKPSTSGRVTRSQTARNSKQVTEKTLSQSFAPKNASFKPPQLKNIPKVPYVNLMALKPIPNKKKNITFDPVLPKIKDHSTKEIRQTRSRTQTKPAVVQNTQSKVDCRPRGKTAKPLSKTNIKFQSSSSSETDLGSPILRNRKSLPAPQTLFQSSTETDSSGQSPVHSIKPQSSTDSDQSAKPMSPIQTRSRKSVPESPILVSKTPRKSAHRMSDKQFTPKNPVPKSESSSEERLRSPKSTAVLTTPKPIAEEAKKKSESSSEEKLRSLKSTAVLTTPKPIAEEAKKISPCVTMSRGKDNARREMKKKLDEGLLDEDISDIDNIEPFRRQLASEIKRMTDMCEQWDRILEQTVLPESIQECVLGAVGQARLLMSQKLQQFASLVERCARPEPGLALVTPADLHGFWDMVFMQVENVDMRFKKLEALRARGWVEEQPAALVSKARVRPAPRAKQVGTSRIKEMIAAARKAKKEVPSELPIPEKTFEAGFFCVKSPVRSPAPYQLSTPPVGRPSLLKAVLSSEANKSASRNSASFAMLRASVFGKNVECEGVAPLPPTPLPQNNSTPYRSILKQTDTAKKSSKKSIKVVLFDKSDSELNESSKLSDEKPESECQELNVDSGLSSMDVEKEGKENSRRKSNRLTRQHATDVCSPVTTRSRRKSNVTPQEKTGQETRRSTRKSRVLEDVESNIKEATPKRTPRRNRMQEGTV